MSYSQELGKEDLFGKLIADSTENRADLASHFDFSQERWRYFRRDSTSGSLSREYIAYGNKTGFTDTVDSYIIEPTSTDYIAQLETAERFRYNVGYTSKISFAFQTNQSLKSGDKVVMGYGDPDLENNMASADGWFVEFVPSLSDSECYFNTYRNGTLVSNGGSNNVVQLEKGITDWRRFEIEINWYNISASKLVESYTNSDGCQIDESQSRTSPTDKKGPQTANKKLTFSIRGGGNGTSLETGSAAVIINGTSFDRKRTKSDRFSDKVTSSKTWVPVLAMRRDPNRSNVFVALKNLTILRYSSENVEMQIKGFSKDKVNFGSGSWSTPDGLSPNNSVLQVRNDVDQIVDQSGNLQSTTDNPGGYQIIASEITKAGKIVGTAPPSETPLTKEIRRVYDDDVAVVLAKSPSSDETFDMRYDVNESW